MNLIEKFPLAKPFTIKGKNEAVLMIHGFTSTPNIFRELAQHIHKTYGFEIEVPLLSGHGLTPEKLNYVTSKDWIRDAEVSMEKLLMRFSKIHLIGLSMGGTLCAHLANRYKNNVMTVTLMAPAMYVSNFISRFQLCIARHFPNKILKPWVVHKSNPDLTENISYHEYSAYSVVQMDAVCRKVKKEFQTNKPCLIFVPERDRTIHPKSAKWFFKRSSNPKSKLIKLEASPHVILLGSENDKIFSEVTDYLTT